MHFLFLLDVLPMLVDVYGITSPFSSHLSQASLACNSEGYELLLHPTNPSSRRGVRSFNEKNLAEISEVILRTYKDADLPHTPFFRHHSSLSQSVPCALFEVGQRTVWENMSNSRPTRLDSAHWCGVQTTLCCFSVPPLSNFP